MVAVVFNAAWPFAVADAQEQRPDNQVTEEHTDELNTELPTGNFLGEVVVTAQKREESDTNVSATVNAFSGQDLVELQVGTTIDLDRLISNVDFKTSSQGVNPAITIRGVGLNNFNSNNNPSVGVSIDNVFLSSPAMLTLFMMDLDRTEVIKGPQGTLYGRNSTGGAINIVSAKPEQQRDLSARLTYGDYNTAALEGVLGGGLSDAWSGRLSVSYKNQGDAFFYDDLGQEKLGAFEEAGLRGQLRYKQGAFDLNLSLAYMQQEGFIGGKEVYGTQDAGDPSSLCPQAADAMAAGGGYDITGLPRGQCVSVIGTYDRNPDLFRSDFDAALIDRMNLDTNLLAGIIHATYDFSGATLTSITGYITQDRLYGEGDIVPGGIFFVEHDEDIRQFSQELRLGGGSAGVRWIGGLFYSYDQIEAFNPLESPGVFGPFFGLNPLYWDYDQESTSLAAFGSVDFHLSETWTLVTGLRYTDETIAFNGGTTAFEAGGPLQTTTDVFNASPEELETLGIPLTFIDDEINESEPSGRIALEFRPNSNNLFYGSVSTGFKSGGYFGDFTIEQEELEPFDKETVIAYEVGAKSTFSGGLFQLNSSVFYYDYDDIQTFVPATIGFKFDNLETARIFGLDLTATWRPVPGLDLLLGAGLLDTEIRSAFPSFDGNELPNAPRYQVNGLIRYMLPISDSLWLTPLLSFKTSDGKFTEATNHPLNYAEGWTTVDLRLSLMPSNLRWELALWSQNLTDERYFEEVFYAEAIGTIGAIPGSPRQWGVTASFKF